MENEIEDSCLYKFKKNNSRIHELVNKEMFNLDVDLDEIFNEIDKLLEENNRLFTIKLENDENNS